jgi:hypothetical protein
LAEVRFYGYLPYAISAFGFVARMAFNKMPDIIAALKCPGDKQPKLMRAMHGLPDRRRIRPECRRRP